MVPTKEFDQLVQYYKGEITDNALLNKAGRLAAESHLILRDKSIPDSIAIKKIKPLARQRGRLTKRIGQIGPLSRRSKCGPNLDTQFRVQVFVEFYVYTPSPPYIHMSIRRVLPIFTCLYAESSLYSLVYTPIPPYIHMF